jgi:hypothetical protein
MVTITQKFGHSTRIGPGIPATSTALEKGIESAVSYLIALFCTELRSYILNVFIFSECFVS